MLCRRILSTSKYLYQSAMLAQALCDCPSFHLIIYFNFSHDVTARSRVKLRTCGATCPCHFGVFCAEYAHRVAAAISFCHGSRHLDVHSMFCALCNLFHPFNFWINTTVFLNAVLLQWFRDDSTTILSFFFKMQSNVRSLACYVYALCLMFRCLAWGFVGVSGFVHVRPWHLVSQYHGE